MCKIQQKKSRRRFKSNETNDESLVNLDFMTRARMFEQRKEQKLQRMKQQFNSMHENKPKINSEYHQHRSSEDFVQRLYQHKRSKSRADQESNKWEEPAVNQKSLEYLCQKLHRDIDNAFKDLETEEDLINREQFKIVLTNLGYTGQDASAGLQGKSND